MNDAPVHARIPWVAAVLSLFCTGLGHIYCGRIVAGLALFLASLLFAPLAVVASWLAPSTVVLLGLIATVFAALGIYLFAVVDAWRAARRISANYQRKDYNRAALYAAFILVGVSYQPGAAAYIRSNAFEAFYVASSSMAPSLLRGDRVLANKTTYRFASPQRGNVVVFRSPPDRYQTWVKRVIGLPGDTVAVRDNQVYVNGVALARDRVPASSLAWTGLDLPGDVYFETLSGARYLIMLGGGDSALFADYPETIVPEGTCFVLGDNRDRSRDSRDFGFVPLGDVLGSVQYVYCPAVTWRRFGSLSD
jgi:signal peptidase I